MLRKILDIFGIRRYCVMLQIWKNGTVIGFISYMVWAGTSAEAEERIYKRIVKNGNFVIIDYNLITEEV